MLNWRQFGHLVEFDRELFVPTHYQELLSVAMRRGLMYRQRFLIDSLADLKHRRKYDLIALRSVSSGHRFQAAFRSLSAVYHYIGHRLFVSIDAQAVLDDTIREAKRKQAVLLLAHANREMMSAFLQLPSDGLDILTEELSAWDGQEQGTSLIRGTAAVAAAAFACSKQSFHPDAHIRWSLPIHDIYTGVDLFWGGFSVGGFGLQVKSSAENNYQLILEKPTRVFLPHKDLYAADKLWGGMQYFNRRRSDEPPWVGVMLFVKVKDSIEQTIFDHTKLQKVIHRLIEEPRVWESIPQALPP